MSHRPNSGPLKDRSGFATLLDEAQGSYRDYGLWGGLKMIPGVSEDPCFVLFASYRNPGMEPTSFSSGLVLVYTSCEQCVPLYYF
jgi:hypothetical protein